MLDSAFPTDRLSSRQELIREIRNALGDAIECEIDTHNTQSIIFIYRNGSGKLLLKAEFGSETATHREIGWYKALGERNLGIAPKHFASYAGEGHAWLLLEFIEGSSTIDELSHGSQEHAHNAVVQGVLASFEADRKLFGVTAKEASPQAIAKFFEVKYEARRREAQQTPHLRDLLDRSRVTINGEEFKTPDKALDKIRSQPALRSYLTPNRVGLTHGDLHGGNVLLRGSDTFFIDPNGQLEMPLEYDLGKMLHSVHGNYGSVMLGEYELEAQGAWRYRFSSSRPEAYGRALDALRRDVTDQEYMRGLYAEALHFATMLPHHARNQKETLALYLRCVQLFNELLILAA